MYNNFLNENLFSSLLSHIAATAHAAAACAASTHFYATYYQQESKKNSDGMEATNTIELIKMPVVPLKSELEKASSTFASLKSKISNFFLTTKEIEKKKNDQGKNENLTASTQQRSTCLNSLVSNYDDINEEENNPEEQIKGIEQTKKSNEFIESSWKLNKQDNFSNKNKIEIDTDDNDAEELDEETDDDDLEIVTTSELKATSKMTRNYLFPSLKTNLFPLKASLNELNFTTNNKCKNLIAVEKSKSALTFLGSPSSLMHGIDAKKRLKLSDILYK
jgi:hypothetical protein